MNRRHFLQTTAALTGFGRARIFAQPRVRMSDVIVILPGIMGSVLAKNGTDVWALSSSAILGNLRSFGDSLDQLTLKGESLDADVLDDGIVATRLLPDAHLIPGFWKVDGYSGLSAAIRQEFDVTIGENFFEFPYDWRRDNRVAAKRLARQSEVWLRRWRQHSGNGSAKLQLVAHSMGGLVAKHFVDCLDGWRSTRSLITFGTPYRGSLNALDSLTNGIRLFGQQLSGLTAVVRSLTSTYQLLPRYLCVDVGGDGLKRVAEVTGIPHVDQARAQAALAFHHELDGGYARHEADDDYRKGFRILPVVGSFQRTLQAARLRDGHLELLAAHPQSPYWQGDGTVPEVSAIPVELSQKGGEMYISQLHASLQNTPAVLDQMKKLLKREDIGAVRGIADKAVSLHIEDAYPLGEPVSIEVVVGREAGRDLTVDLIETTSGRHFRREMAKVANDTYRMNAGLLPKGLYRVSVDDSVSPAVTDVFIVTDREQ